VSRPESIAAAAKYLLGELDPDLEYEARRTGPNVIGMSREAAERLATLLQLPVRVASTPERVLAAGVLADRKLIEAYFGSSRPRLGRLVPGSQRPVRAG